MNQSKVLVITGPTATGKTGLGVMLAELCGGEVISADSMQVYKGMVIGTAAPSEKEMRGIPHHLIGYVSPFEAYSAARYVSDASACIEDITRRGKLPIIVGGTGLYIDSLLSGRSFMGGDISLREKFSAEYDDIGGEAMLERLSKVDAESAAKLHGNDKKRIVRALEVYYSTGKTITEHNRESRLIPERYKSCRIALNYRDRSVLYAHIDARVDKMLSLGLVAEVQSLLASGLNSGYTSMQAIGYKEIAAAINGEYSLAEAVETVKRESRRYAKRQLSWLGANSGAGCNLGVNWIMWENEPDYKKASQISTKIMANNGIM
jgi:tRNA dimethylallyltransferase